MKKQLLVLCMLFAAVAFCSCDDDDETIFDRLTGRVWIGNLGMTDLGGYPLESGVYLGADGFGTDDLRYYDNGEPFGVLNLQWDAYNGTVYLNYGNMAPPRELRDVRVHRGSLTGDLFINGYYISPTTLRMQ